MGRIQNPNAWLGAFIGCTVITVSAGCHIRQPAPVGRLLERRLTREEWSAFSETYSPDRGHRVAFLPFKVVVRESGRMYETWEVLDDEVLELTSGSERRHRYRWFEEAQVFAYCRETFPKPFFIARDSMTAAQVFGAARRIRLGECDAQAVLRIAGGHIGWSSRPSPRATLADLSEMTLTRQDRAAIRNLGPVETLVLSNSSVIDADLAYLSGLSSMRNLALDGTDVSDEGLRFIARLPLRRLDLSGTRVTDGGIVTLAHLSSLRVIGLGNTAVTPAGMDSLRAALPRVVIRR